MAKFMLFGEGNAKEQAFCEQCWGLGAGADLLCCISGRNFYLEHRTATVHVADIAEAIKLAKARRIDTIILLSLEQFEAGNFEAFQEAGFTVFGMPMSAIYLENSKAEAKSFMKRHAVASAESSSFSEVDDAEEFLRNHWGEKRFVIKASCYLSDILYSCTIPGTLEEALVAARALFHHLERIGAAREVVIEERLNGREFSLHLLVDGPDYKILPMVRDYKRLFRDDRGPNTAGIGSVATTVDWDFQLLADLRSRIVDPTVKGLLLEGICYKFILYIGVMITNDGPVALEYNVRPGTPEFPALLALSRTSGLEIVSAILGGRLKHLDLKWNTEESCSVAVTLTAPGYPFSTEGFGEPVEGLDDIDGTVWALAENIPAAPSPVVSSGRVLTIVARGKSFAEARKRAYENADKIRFNGVYCRRDIGELVTLR